MKKQKISTKKKKLKKKKKKKKKKKGRNGSINNRDRCSKNEGGRLHCTGRTGRKAGVETASGLGAEVSKKQNGVAAGPRRIAANPTAFKGKSESEHSNTASSTTGSSFLVFDWKLFFFLFFGEENRRHS